jgi:Domain of unknown function DUF11/CARDB/HYR domain/Secretion system C-terminal sorting domain
MKKNVSLFCFKILIVSILLHTSSILFSQVNYTAHDRVIPYDGSFRFGVNMGYYPGWTSEQLGHLSAGNASLGLKGVGINTARPALYEELLETFGYDALVPTFEGYYQSGIRDMTMIVGGPSGPHRDYTQYCPGKFSDLFANLYEPIWDGGLNGTPVNEKNYYATYLWKTVTNYKKYVKIWEIVNEPDFDESITQWRTDFDLNYGWWRENPDPCSYQLHAPIFNYIRMLRISWEIIKSVDPNAQVSVGALGYASFLDLVLRNTDNPNNGAVSTDFPLKGGAYFDIMGYHIYPHIDASLWTYNPNFGITGYHRHSDAAIDSGLVKKQAFFQSVLTKYGYDGSKYPQKPWVLTEFNLPRKAFSSNYVGSDDIQINSVMKAAIECQKRSISQLHVYQLGDKTTFDAATYEFDLMGLYKKLEGSPPYNVAVNPMGIAYKTTSDLIFGGKYDVAQTNALNLPSNIKGAAFRKTDNSVVYALWAKTTIDKSENASANYTFPASMGLNGLKRYAWDFGQTGAFSDINANSSIALSGTPIFLTASNVVVTTLPDLTLTNLNIQTPSVLQGQKVDFKVDIRNVGQGNASGNFSLKSYISKDNVLNADDIQTGTINTGGYNAGFVSLQIAGAVTVPATLAAGQYYVIAKIDADDQVGETNENNNVIASGGTFTVTVINPPSTTCSNSILKNAGYESGLAEWGGGGEIVTTGAFAGSNALKLCKIEDRIFQSQVAQAGKTYNFRVYGKVDVSTEGYFGIKFMNSSFVPIDFLILPINSTTYSTHTPNGTATSRIAPVGTAYVEVFAAKSVGTGCIYVDDWCLTEGGTTGGDPCDTDTTPPNITCPPNITATATAGQESASVTIALPTVSDNCGIISTLRLTKVTGETVPTPNSIAILPIGTTNLRWIVTDAKGNAANCTYSATVTAGNTGGGGTDLGLSITANSATYKKWTNLDFTISAKNNGSTAFSNVVVQFKFPAGTVSGGAVTPSVGIWKEWCAGGTQCYQWEIPSVAANATVSLTVPVFVLDVSTPIVGTTTLLSSTPTDTNIGNNTASVTVNGASPEPQAGLLRSKDVQLLPVVIQKVAPNPSDDITFIEVESLKEQTVTIQFFNNVGKLVGSEQRQVQKGHNVLYLDVTPYASGMYFISTEYQRQPVKFVKM